MRGELTASEEALRFGGASGAIQSLSKNLSDCGTVPYHRFFLVRNEEVVGSNPISSTRFKKTGR
jgi:hypothetical protein